MINDSGFRFNEDHSLNAWFYLKKRLEGLGEVVKSIFKSKRDSFEGIRA